MLLGNAIKLKVDRQKARHNHSNFIPQDPKSKNPCSQPTML
ncbi:MAG: hypothetical protein ANABAC_1706 [Anaerolineae bacterium]|nr:MAG: hypothetical protein ANABAC_1706 [Anaerolineae bacterium]